MCHVPMNSHRELDTLFGVFLHTKSVTVVTLASQHQAQTIYILFPLPLPCKPSCDCTFCLIRHSRTIITTSPWPRMSRPSSRSRQPSPFATRRLRRDSDAAELLGTDVSAIHAGRTAVITGAASGIGFAGMMWMRHNNSSYTCLSEFFPLSRKEIRSVIIPCHFYAI